MLTGGIETTADGSRTPSRAVLKFLTMLLLIDILLLLAVFTGAIVAIGGETWIKGNEPVLKRITARGWISIMVLVIGLALGVCKEILTKSQEEAKEADAKAREKVLQTKLDDQTSELNRVQDELKKSNQSLARAREALTNEITGGDSFAFVRVYNIVGDQGSLFVQHHGKYQLHGVVAHLIDPDKHLEETMYRIGDLPVNGIGTIGEIHLNPAGKHSLKVLFTAMNNNWNEDIQLRRVNGEWLQALRVFREIYMPIKNGKQPIEDKLAFTLIDPGYPRVDGKVWDQGTQ